MHSFVNTVKLYPFDLSSDLIYSFFFPVAMPPVVPSISTSAFYQTQWLCFSSSEIPKRVLKPIYWRNASCAGTELRLLRFTSNRIPAVHNHISFSYYLQLGMKRFSPYKALMNCAALKPVAFVLATSNPS